MAKERRIPNYRKMYPEASEEVIALLRQGERKLLYHEYDLKVEKFIVDEEKQKVFFIQSKEDSLERLIEADVQFYDEDTNVEEIAIKAVMINKLLEGLKHLTKEEHELITALFYEGMTEREYAEIKGVYHNAIHKRKIRILKKLENFFKK
ncbi:sigma-70 family RNA polymerase sigma factor [Sedimentibacter sp.]|uniref:sigma-70 family RNA polymerase sigma factor n=1 Tax=Sedimentibacter sp. TaxID=1960295 RepID=UPI0028983378|nr:sigma-70 family RNA polymerase sigma factor [Sedimentibacter sp.]